MLDQAKPRTATMLRSQHTDAPVGASDLQSPSRHTPPVNFEAVLALQPYIRCVAQRTLARAGQYQSADVRELAAEITYQIVEQATRRQGYLANTPAYVVSFALWRALNYQRHSRFEQSWYSLDALLEEWTSQAQPASRTTSLMLQLSEDNTASEAKIDIDRSLGRLSPAARTMLTEIRNLLDVVLTRDGSLNESELSRCLDRPCTTVRRQVKQLRAELADVYRKEAQ